MSNLKKLDKPSVKQLYQIMYDVDKIFVANGLEYFADSGTLLGALRHYGIIPWDDDIDLGIMQKDVKKFLSLRPLLKKCGYSISKVWFGYKIFYTNMKKTPGENYSFPFIDIFAYKMIGKKFHKASWEAREVWPKEHFFPNELYPLKRVKFGPITMPVPNKGKQIMTNFYGKTWNTVAYRQYDHKTEEEVESVKVTLTAKDRVPAKYDGKINKERSCVSGVGKNVTTKYMASHKKSKSRRRGSYRRRSVKSKKPSRKSSRKGRRRGSYRRRKSTRRKSSKKRSSRRGRRRGSYRRRKSTRRKSSKKRSSRNGRRRGSYRRRKSSRRKSSKKRYV